MQQGNKCWLCLRTTPRRVLEASHRLFPDDTKTAHQVGIFAANILKEAYLKNPPALCGRTSKALIGGALYIACLQKNIRVSQREVCDAGLDVTETALRNSYQLIARTLGILADWPQKYRGVVAPKT